MFLGFNQFSFDGTMNNTPNIAFHSVISAIQKVALYETKTVSDFTALETAESLINWSDFP